MHQNTLVLDMTLCETLQFTFQWDLSAKSWIFLIVILLDNMNPERSMLTVDTYNYTIDFILK